MTDDVNFRFGVNAKVILDSVSPNGDRLTTIEATFHRFILAEVNTHRSHSRNSASSRAIPFRKQLERVRNNPAIPVSFPAEQRGMSGGDEIEQSYQAVLEWLDARDCAVEQAQALADLGVHKSVVNRILEPFMWHTAILSATQDGWDNLLHQRNHPAAQPEFMVLAEKIAEVMDKSKPRQLNYNEWHLPYLDAEAHNAANRYAAEFGGRATEVLKQVSAARCARVSYLTHDGKRSIEKDLELFARLRQRANDDDDPVHWSPLEHVATPCRDNDNLGNFRGWHQFRHLDR